MIRHAVTVIQDVAGDSAVLMLAQKAPGSSSFGNFWEVVEQAGPLRWPIFIILGLGLVLVAGKLYELVRDRITSRPLFEYDLASANLASITTHVSQQQSSMLVSLQSAMLNVFHTRPTEGMLHDEITNFVSFQQDQFGVFRRRMEFLSDTAGALGLMGTVWGMFTVFFQGTSDKDVILRGMGIALITTLLGLVVSIILSLAATELSTFFGRRLEQISKKSDELRFRLLEIAAGRVDSAPGAAGPAVSIPQSASAPAATASVDTTPAPPTPQYHLLAEPAEYSARAGETVPDIRLLVHNGDGGPVSGIPIEITIPTDGGRLPGRTHRLQRETDDTGQVRFNWTVPERAGRFALEASLPGQPGPARRVDLRVDPGVPARIEHEGNNQAAVAGLRLAHPLSVLVFDPYDNPIPGVQVTFRATGGGRFGQHGTELTVHTDSSGTAAAAFAVSSDAGQNTVVAEVDGERVVDFIAFGTEL